MLRKIFLPTIVALLAWGFWISPDFKEIAAGVSIFLFGMLALEDGFRRFTGGTLERILQGATNRLWKSITFGVLSTTIMQSSSLVSVITISFLSAGLIGLSEGIGIVFGANLGTTTGAWLVAGFGLKVKISAYAMPMLVFGVLMIFQRSKTLKGIGYVLTGLGFLFLGIHYMKEGFEAFKDSFDLAQYAMPGYAGLFIFSAIGIAATVVMQSSHATLVLTITALAAGQITYENGMALAIGANVGTTITAIIGAMSANAQGRRLAGAHLIFNLITGLIAIGFIGQFIAAVDWLAAEVGIAADDYTLKLALFHTLFNLVGVALMVPLIGTLVRLLNRLIREREVTVSQPHYLNESAIAFPDTATEAVRMETLHVWNNAISIIAGGLSFAREDILSERDLEKIAQGQRTAGSYDIDAEYEQKIKSLYSAVIAFISRATFSWDHEQTGEVHWLRKANQNIVEAIKGIKHLQKNLRRYIVSPNQEIRDEYNRLRLQLAMVVRELELIRHCDPEEIPTMALDHLKIQLDEASSSLNQRLGSAIRNHAYTPQVATSLLNDSTYVNDIIRNLMEMAETLFIKQRKGLSDSEGELLLTDDELKDIQNSSDQGQQG